jgi:hypothetical protein
MSYCANPKRNEECWVRGEDGGASAAGLSWGLCQPVEGVAAVERHALPCSPPRSHLLGLPHEERPESGGLATAANCQRQRSGPAAKCPPPRTPPHRGKHRRARTARGTDRLEDAEEPSHAGIRVAFGDVAQARRAESWSAGNSHFHLETAVARDRRPPGRARLLHSFPPRHVCSFWSDACSSDAWMAGAGRIDA